jgi:hypothetical protein
MDPRLIRANIALFKGKRLETQRLLEEYIEEQANPEAVRRNPMILWLDAQARSRHAERLSALNTLIEQVPPEHRYHRMAKDYLQDEAKYRQLLDADGQQRGRVRPWQVFAGLAAVALVIVVGVLLSQSGAPPAADEELPLVLDEATVTPAPPTAIPQNTPQPVLVNGAPPTTGYEMRGYNGVVTVLAVDPAVRTVVDSLGFLQEPMPGATFYGLLIQFQCLVPVCNNIPEAEIYLRLSSDASQSDEVQIRDVKASENLFVAGEPPLAGRAVQGTIEGWLVFELPRGIPAGGIVVWPLALPGSQARPPSKFVSLS